jgi:Uma2 family endonuclease
MMAIPFPHYKFTVEDYYRMAEAGILHEDDRVELIDGEIIELPPIGSDHAGTVDDFADRIRGQLPPDVRVRVQNPVRLGPRTEPEPDLAVVKRQGDYYRTAHPDPEDVYLLIEVSDSTLTYDRQTKGPRYASAGIPEYWIVNLVDRVIEIYREPAADGYRSVEIARPGDEVSPLAFPDVRIAVSDILV